MIENIVLIVVILHSKVVHIKMSLSIAKNVYISNMLKFIVYQYCINQISLQMLFVRKVYL